jgi:hypothetical protein
VRNFVVPGVVEWALAVTKGVGIKEVPSSKRTVNLYLSIRDRCNLEIRMKDCFRLHITCVEEFSTF